MIYIISTKYSTKALTIFYMGFLCIQVVYTINKLLASYLAYLQLNFFFVNYCLQF